MKTLEGLHSDAPDGHHDGMPRDHESFDALRSMLEQVELLISTTAPLPENRTARSLELLKTALLLVDDLASQAA